jgi:hypothetical protein
LKAHNAVSDVHFPKSETFRGRAVGEAHESQDNQKGHSKIWAGHPMVPESDPGR